MKNTKITIATFALILTLTVTALIASMPSVEAADVDTYAYLTVVPDPIGVNQQLTITLWLNHAPPTASGPQGDRWEDMTIEVTKPDGTKENLGPFTADATGATWSQYTPTQVGTYNFQMSFPGQTLTGIPGMEDHSSVGDYYRPSTSRVCEITVQQEPIDLLPASQPPEYWERPLYAENRELWQLGSNWLMAAYDTTSRSFDSGSAYAPNNKAPNSAHILWTRPLTFGGLIGAEYPSVAYYQGLSYETMLSLGSFSAGALIINGRLYYNTPLPPKYGFYCVDLSTGETIYYKNGTEYAPYPYGRLPLSEGGYFPGGVPLSFGQILDYESPNQHGGTAYLWSNVGSTWHMFDAWTGNYILTIANVTSGTITFGPHGEILVYNIDDNQLIVWNSTKAIPAPWPTGSGSWQWRPDLYRGQTLDGTIGIEMTITLEDNPSIRVIGEDVIYAQTGDTWIAYDRWTGAKLWSAELTRPEYPAGTYRGAATLTPYSIHDEVYAEFIRETMQWYGYDIRTGQLIWGPSDPYTDDWGYYSGYTSRLGAYGNIYAAGYDGKVYCYDIKTGDSVWDYYAGSAGFETPYGSWPFYGGLTIADEKVFAATGEHSPSTPMWKGEKLHVINAYTGDPVWKISGWYQANSMVVADGKLVALNGYDNQLYCFGKGPSATTVTASPKVIAEGTSVLIEGMVTDESAGTTQNEQAARFPNGVPAVSDESMGPWMEYVYMQKPMPIDASGVTVTLDAIDQNGKFFSIGKVSSDLSGMFKKTWTPENEGEYTIIATFEGSESYWASYAETAVGVGPAPTSEETNLTSLEDTVSNQTTYILAILVIVIIALIIALYSVLKSRK